MQLVLVPRDVTARTADVWVAGPAAGVAGHQVVVRANGKDHPIVEWADTRGIAHQVVTIRALDPATEYRLELFVDGARATFATVRTLPTALPGAGEEPFIIMLASCFCRRNDAGGAVQRAYERLASSESPAINVWAGDQVYLDSPAQDFTLSKYTSEELESLFRDNYAFTWDAQHGAGSLGKMLASASNYFTSDDHEFWNNFPNIAPLVRNSWRQPGRDAWTPVATEFYSAFQTPRRSSELNIGTMSLRLADVRIDRDAGERNFMRETPDLDALCAWLDNLTGPGFLVLGQPVFEKATNITGHATDWKLPDYQQYPRLVRALLGAKHSVVVLTGDVHFGRIAQCKLASGARLLEIISSPLALVSKVVAGSWKIPDKFPNDPIPGVVAATIEPLPDKDHPFKSEVPHFLTLELRAWGAGVDLRVRYWPIDPHDPRRGSYVFRDKLN